MHELNLNPVAFSTNLARAVEIALLGNHRIYIKAHEEYINHIKDFAFIKAEYSSYMNGVTFIDSPTEINIEIDKPDMDSLFHNRFEGQIEVVERVLKAKENKEPQLKLDNTSYNLLKNAYQRLNLSMRDIQDIISVAATIARLDYRVKIDTVHVAEAIQYKCII